MTRTHRCRMMEELRNNQNPLSQNRLKLSATQLRWIYLSSNIDRPFRVGDERCDVLNVVFQDIAPLRRSLREHSGSNRCTFSYLRICAVSAATAMPMTAATPMTVMMDDKMLMSASLGLLFNGWEIHPSENLA